MVVPTLQVPGQVVSFLTRHLGFPIPSPAILERVGLRFRKAVTEFAAEGDIPVIRFATVALSDRLPELVHLLAQKPRGRPSDARFVTVLQGA